MTKPTLPKTSNSHSSNPSNEVRVVKSRKKRKMRRSNENSDVLISAVLSPYLLTHLHHVLQRAEFSASREGRTLKAANYAQLRKVLCMDARSMKDASAQGLKDSEFDKCQDDLNHEQKVA